MSVYGPFIRRPRRPRDLFAPTDRRLRPDDRRSCDTTHPGAGEETHTHQPGAEPRNVPAQWSVTGSHSPPRLLVTKFWASSVSGEWERSIWHGKSFPIARGDEVPAAALASQRPTIASLVEVRALAALDHPNIIRVLSTDFFRSDPFFTTEYFSNGSLLKRVEDAGPLEPLEAAKLMAMAARAVHAANQKGVIHRDLKPSNILLTADGVPKVADFGLAKRLDQDDDLTTATAALGSPPYMAPEQTGRMRRRGS